MIGLALIVAFACGFAVGAVAPRRGDRPVRVRAHELGGLSDRLIAVAPVHRDLSACVCGHDFPHHREGESRSTRCWFGGCGCRRFAAAGVYAPRS